MDTPTTILEHAMTMFARELLEHGLDVHPVSQTGDHKTPVAWWLKRPATPADFEPTHNIGLKTGSPFGKDAYIADVDLDMKDPQTKQLAPGAGEIVDALLPPCRHTFGRKGAPASHRIYLTPEPVCSIKYEGIDGRSLIELRGLARKSKKPQQTVIAGIHHTGERISGFRGHDFTRFDGDGLRERVSHAAVALALLDVWPAVGSRHDARLAFAKILLDAALDVLVCKDILKAVVKATGGNVEDVASCVHDTASAMKADPTHAVGVSWIQEHLGDAGLNTIRAIHKILGIKARPDGIIVNDIKLREQTPAVWKRLDETNAAKPRLFLQGGLPVRVAHIPERRNDKKQTHVFQTAGPDVIRHEVANVERFYHVSKNGPREVAPPDVIIKNMLAVEPKDIPLPVVSRIVYAPTVAPDGTIQVEPGYQKLTGTYYVPSDLHVPPMPSLPSNDDIRQALDMLRTPIKQFPFIDDSDRAHALAFLLLPFVRDLIDGPTPLHLFEKSIAGEGASLLTDVLLYPAVGSDVARLPPCSDDAEWRKQITSSLLEGPSVLQIDNARELISPTLALAITGTVWKARILGFSRDATLPISCVWGATGINPTLHQEIVRRVVRCRLQSGEEYPWLRTGFKIPDLRSWCREHRASMIHAALTLVRHWFNEGQPKGDRVLGMFESWSHVVGGILHAAGVSGFLSKLEEFYAEADLEGDAIRWLFEEWASRHATKPVKIGEVRMWALAADSPVLSLIGAKNEAGAGQAFGAFLKRMRGRVVTVGEFRRRIEIAKKATNESRNTYQLGFATRPADSEKREAPTLPLDDDGM